MVIYEQKCERCLTNLKANGQSAFKIVLIEHLENKHPDIYKILKARRKEAQEKFYKLRCEYKELFFSWSFFQIDLKQALENKGGIENESNNKWNGS